MAGLSIFNIRRKSTEEERFRELFLSMHPKLIRYATTLIGEADEAKDIVSEVFERAWENFSSFGDEASVWLYTATRNACLNRLKHLQVEQTHIEAIVHATQADVDNGFGNTKHCCRRRKPLPEVYRNLLALFSASAIGRRRRINKWRSNWESVPTQ